jgi:ferritin
MKTTIINESITPVDPTIVKKPNQLRKEVTSLLNQRIGDEYTAHYFYRNAANWCHNMSYKKAAEFFDKEAKDELKHAQGLQKYMTDWDVKPLIPSVRTDVNFNNLAEIIVQAYDMEFGLLQSYSENAKTIFGLGDLATFTFLQDYVKQNTGSTAEYADFLNALQLINPENNFELLYFENQYFG